MNELADSKAMAAWMAVVSSVPPHGRGNRSRCHRCRSQPPVSRAGSRESRDSGEQGPGSVAPAARPAAVDHDVLVTSDT